MYLEFELHNAIFEINKFSFELIHRNIYLPQSESKT